MSLKTALGGPFWRETWPLLTAAALAEAAFLGMAYLRDLGARIPLTWAAFYTAFAVYALVSWRVLRRPAGDLRLILGAALLFRLTLLPTAPSLSDDIYRYVWDGHVQWSGVNPYRYAPEASQLTDLRTELPEIFVGINHRHIPTIYPPVSQLFFAAATGLSEGSNGVRAVKLGLLLCEVALAVALLGLLRQRGLDDRRIDLYAWNPLAVVEIAGSGHVDALALALLFGALYWMGRRAWRSAALALSAAFLAKLLPAVALPLLWRHCALAIDGDSQGGHGNRQPGALRRLLSWPAVQPLLWFALGAAAGYGLYASAGTRLFAGLQTYALTWRFNDSAYTVVHLAVGALGAVVVEGDLPEGHVLHLARWFCGAAFLVAAAWIVVRRTDPVRATFALLALHLVLAPTLHPWYVLWVVPFLPLFPNPAWVSLSGLVFLAYWVLDGYRSTGVWWESPWVRWAEYVPFYALLGLTWWRHRARPR